MGELVRRARRGAVELDPEQNGLGVMRAEAALVTATPWRFAVATGLFMPARSYKRAVGG
jgi:hypothetical protein